MKTVIEQLEEFIERMKQGKFPCNAWLEDRNMKVYVRHGRHVINGEMRETMDLANVEVTHKGKGRYKKFMEAAHEMNPWDGTYHENTLNSRLADHHRRTGKIECGDPDCPCFYRAKK